MNTPPYPEGDNVSHEQEEADLNNEDLTWLYFVAILAIIALIVWGAKNG